MTELQYKDCFQKRPAAALLGMGKEMVKRHVFFYDRSCQPALVPAEHANALTTHPELDPKLGYCPPSVTVG